MSRLGLCAAACCVIVAGVLGAATTAAAQNAVSSPTLDTVKKRGELACGIDTGVPGYAFQDAAGNWKGLDVSLCRAIAAAIFDDPTKVKFLPQTAQVRFQVLKSGEIDVLIRDSEMTLLRAGQLGLMEPAMNFYAGQSFLVRKSLGVQHAKDLNGATICLESGTTLETNIANYNRANNIQIKTLLFSRFDQAIAALEAGRCDGYTDDGGSAAAARSNMKNPSDWVILPETIARQPMGPYTRQGDDRWTNIVAWTHYAMLEGEVLGITQANIDQVKAATKDPQVRLFLGLEGNLGKGLGLENDFAYEVIKAVGNYGEVYEAYFGSGPHGLGLARGLNNLYSNGGLMMPPSWY
jgi:general L-amino acid transport system substrate-binding protein